MQMKDKNKEIERREKIAERDKAVFEAGIKLGALYHQFIGTPLSSETVEELERAIERSVSLQPYVSNVVVKIDKKMIKERERENKFKYCELSGKMLDVKVVVLFEAVEVHARIKYEKEMDYPLMCIEKVCNIKR